MIRTIISILALTLLVSAGAVASNQVFAAGVGNMSPATSQCLQAGGPGHGFGGPGGRGNPHGRQMRQHIEQLRMLKLLELLDLNEDQEVGFLVAYRQAKRNLKAVEDSVRAQVDSLAAGIRQSSLQDGEILELIASIDRLESARFDRLRQLSDEVRPLLNAEQQGKVVVFLHRFEEELLRQVRAFRDRGGDEQKGFRQVNDSLSESNR